MEESPDVRRYIRENGGPDGFDPETNPDGFMELMQVINAYENHNNEQLMALESLEYLETLARYYIGKGEEVKFM